jgi:Holliday junction resolvasome RuvABC ATP-dependent DNA helicase subunit
MNHSAFNHIVGQDHLKRQLSFYLDAYKATATLPFLMFNGQRGIGKTEFARAVGAACKKTFYEINSSSIKNEKQFFEQLMPQIQDTECCLFFDEAHELPRKLVVAFLSIFNTEKKSVVYYNYQDVEYRFDFTKMSFIFATTEMDRLFAPFKDRLTVVDFVPYTNDEVKRIIQKRLPDVKFENGVLNEIATTIRGNARSAVKRAKDIEMYCEANNNPSFTMPDWVNLCEKANINKRGLSNTEIQILNALKERGPLTLTMLSAITGLSVQALRKDAELHLLKMNLIRIDGKRELTSVGMRFLETIV